MIQFHRISSPLRKNEGYKTGQAKQCLHFSLSCCAHAVPGLDSVLDKALCLYKLFGGGGKPT